MFICQFNGEAEGESITNITTLFDQYRERNIHATVAAAWRDRFPIPFSRLTVTPQSYTMLADRKSQSCVASQFVISSPLVGCPMVMSYDTENQHAYVCHASGGLSEDMSDVLRGRENKKNNRILLMTPILSSEGDVVDGVYTDIVTALLGMGYGTNDICLIDGMKLASMVWMSGSGDFAVA